MELSGKVAVVTGAASGIGFGLAQRFVAEGMNVVLADVEASALDDAAAALRDAGGRVHAVVTDITDAGQVRALATETDEVFGAVHVLCNNAGVGVGGTIAEMTLDDWKWVIDVDLWGVIHGLHTFLPRMLAHGQRGHIVNTASMSALSGGQAAYYAAKAGVFAISETLAEELAATGGQLGVSVLCPGVVNTRVHQCARNRPGHDPSVQYDATSRLGDILTDTRALDPADIAESVVRAIHDRQLYVFTHPEWMEYVTPRFERILLAAKQAEEAEQ